MSFLSINITLHLTVYYKFKIMSRSTSNLGSGDLFIPSTPAKESHDLLLFEEQKDRNPAWALIKDRPLETCYDVLCDTNTFQVTGKVLNITIAHVFSCTLHPLNT